METKTEKPSDMGGKPHADDIGVAVVAEIGEVEHFTEEEDRAVRWKIDLHLMPLVSHLIPSHPPSGHGNC